MKILGSILMMVGALYAFLQFRRQSISELNLGRELAGDLAVLKREICISRKTLPLICLGFRNRRSGQVFWEPLRCILAEKKMPVQYCWETATEQLPPALSVRLAPLGVLLGEGGSILASAVDEVREELLKDLGEAERELSLSMRLVGAVCFSSAFFLILMLY